MHLGPLEWRQVPAKFYEHLPSGSKYIHRSLYLKPATPLGCVCPKVNNFVTIVTIVADSKQLGCQGRLPWCIKSNPTVGQGSLNKFEPQ
jgi:hypothetical protein